MNWRHVLKELPGFLLVVVLPLYLMYGVVTYQWALKGAALYMSAYHAPWRLFCRMTELCPVAEFAEDGK